MRKLQPPVVSLIICTHDRAEALLPTLEAIGRVEVPREMPAELLVVDNASSDHTAEVVRSWQMPNMPVRYIHEPRMGKSHALNTALAEARGRVYLFTDDDIRPPEEWIARMCGPILRSEADAVVGGIHLAPHLEQEWLRPYKGWLACTDTWEPSKVMCMCGGNMAFSRAVMEKIPGYDTEIGPGALGSGEESLFSYQVRQAGFRIVAALDVVVEHHIDLLKLTRDGFLDYAQRRGRSEAYIDYHWAQTRHRLPYLKMGRSYLKLLRWRLRRGRLRGPRNGQPPENREIDLIRGTYFWKQYMKERKRPRNYERRGLVKLHNDN